MDVRELQRSLNRFTDHYLKGVKKLKVDGDKGHDTNSRIMGVKYYLGYGKDRDGSVKPLFVKRMRHPHSPRFSTPAMLKTGAGRRRHQRKLASRPVPGKDSYLWGGSRYATNIAVAIAARHGVGISRRKWSGSPINGNYGSDHNTWNTTADAVDLPTFNGRGLATEIAHALGASYMPGSWNNSYVTHNGRRYRIQILFNAPDGSHGDHVHVGVRRA